MCGILALFHSQENIKENYQNGKLLKLRNKILELSKRIRHRGPDWNGIYLDIQDNHLVCLAHERLAIIDVVSGSQPIVSQDGNLILSVNGEIYNHLELRAKTQDSYQYQSQSDCEPILAIYQQWKNKKANLDISSVINSLDGIYSFVLYDKTDNSFLVARDPIGVNPLYYGLSIDNEIYFASEMKCLTDVCVAIQPFPPGHYIYSTAQKSDLVPKRFYNPSWFNYHLPESFEPSNEDFTQVCDTLSSLLIKSVHKRLMSDVPYGVLLSGGLDSSLVASIASRYISKHNSPWGDKIHSFSIGLKGSPDLAAAQVVAKFIGSIHHEYHFTVQEGMDAIRDVIYHLETFDVTTVRASTPMYLLSRKIKAMGIKMVLSGEGADEILGGYLYFHQAPTPEEFNQECIRKVKGLHYFDCLRANKSTMAWGLEVRVPFLDQEFLDYAIKIHPDYKCASKNQEYNTSSTSLPVSGQRRIEKYVLRKAFATKMFPYLPDSILWRQKEQFSDGVGYSWIDTLVASAEYNISEREFQNASLIYPDNTPNTKEAYAYRKIFEEFYPGRHNCVAKWIPQTDWKGVDADPSGRAQNVHDAHNDWE